MELKTRARHDTTSERCPYCHDQLQDETGLVRIECPGCKTTHHRVCIQELGRCSVWGCEHPIDISAIEAEHAESRVLRVIRQRYRDRARRFAQRNSRGLPERVAERLAEARQASREELKLAAEAWDDLYVMLREYASRDPAVQRAAEHMQPRDCLIQRRLAQEAHVHRIHKLILLCGLGVILTPVLLAFLAQLLS